MKRFLAILLVAVTVLPLLVACNGDKTDPAATLDVIKNGACVIYYDATTTSTDTVKGLQSAIETATGIKPEAKRSGTPTPGAILLGNLELPDGTHVAQDLRVNDFMLGIVNGFYVIAGIEHSKTAEAVEHFTKNLLPRLSTEKTLTLTTADDQRVNGTYRVGEITVGGVSLGRFDIQVPSSPTISEWRTAVLLCQHIEENAGYRPEILTSDKAATANVILIGEELCATEVTNAHDYAINVSGTVIEVVAESVFGYLEAQEELMDELFFTREKNVPVALNNESSKSGNGEKQAENGMEINGDLRIMFHNIHGQIENGTMPVKQPTEMMVELYLEYLPDILGLQECTSHTFGAKIDDLLSSEYAMAYGSETCTALFYRTETLELLESGYYCFNQMDPAKNPKGAYPELMFGDNHIYQDLIEENGFTTDEVYNNNTNSEGKTGQSRYDGSKGVTWGIFRHKETGNVFFAGSTHLWWEGNDTLDDLVRMAQMRALRHIASKEAAEFATENNIEAGTIPIFIGGDYNSNSSRESLSTMKGEYASDSAPDYTNINDISTIELMISTHHAYAKYDKDLDIYVDPVINQNPYTWALDHIFINNEGKSMITANITDILRDLYTYLSSDHQPIYTDLTFNETAPKINQ